MRQWKSKLKQCAIQQLLLETGVDLSPEIDVWGILDKTEEENVLARMYNDKMFIALLRKYAEGANKALIARPNTDQEYWKLRGQFFCYNSILLKARRAFIRLQNKNGEQEQN